jgi:hypothetical protein
LTENRVRLLSATAQGKVTKQAGCWWLDDWRVVNSEINKMIEAGWVSPDGPTIHGNTTAALTNLGRRNIGQIPGDPHA